MGKVTLKILREELDVFVSCYFCLHCRDIKQEAADEKHTKKMGWENFSKIWKVDI